MHDIPPRYLKMILRYIYCGRINLTTLKSLEISKLLIIVEVFDIQSLVSCIKEYLNNNINEFLQQNENLLGTNEGYDVNIYSGQAETNIRAHSVILLTRSPYFRRELYRENVE